MTFEQLVETLHKRKHLLLASVLVGVFLGMGVAIVTVVTAAVQEFHETCAAELVKSAEAHLERAEYDAAVAACTSALALDRDSARAWVIRGDARLGEKDYAGALADYDGAIEAEPRWTGSGKWWGHRAKAKCLMGDAAGAISDGETAVTLTPRDANLWIVLGAARAKARDWKGADADLTRALGIDPRSVRAVADRALVREWLKDKAAARADWKRVLELAAPGSKDAKDASAALGRLR